MQKLLGNHSKGQLFVISAPAGTGKNTLVDMLKKEFPSDVSESVSCTTRPPRHKEIKGKHYHFFTEADFEQKVQEGAFIEHASIYGYRYGTLKKSVEDELVNSKHVVMVIDTQGAMQIKEVTPAIFIFVAPPSHEELNNRLLTRKTEDESMRLKRLEWSKHELEQIIHYDYLIVNDNLEIAYQALRSIIVAEAHKTRS